MLAGLDSPSNCGIERAAALAQLLDRHEPDLETDRALALWEVTCQHHLPPLLRARLQSHVIVHPQCELKW